MKLLDLFCGAGGCSAGYNKAGFKVTGVDIKPQPRYPFEFIQADAISYLKNNNLHQFDVIHASPPCQAYSPGTYTWRKEGREYPDLLSPIRKLLQRSGKIFIIENVETAPMKEPYIKLCGEMFNLGVIRHRLFESNVKLPQPKHPSHKGTVSDGSYVTVAGHGGDGSYCFQEWCSAMNISWMNREELTQAIPPDYTEYIGKQILRYLEIKSSFLGN